MFRKMSCDANSDAQSLACPRCDSHDTKFCYYNNYSTAQPRHFCKNCKRYWTAGGSLRNVPVGGGLRKSKKSKLSKHGKDLLSASPDEFLHPGMSATSLRLASPSSSTDGLVDDSFAAPVVQPLLAYRPTFDFTADNDFPGEIRTMPASPFYSLHHINLAPNSEHHGSGLSANCHYQLVHDKRSGLRYPENCYGGRDGEPRIHEEMSQSRTSQGILLSDMNKGYSSTERPQNYDRNEINSHPRGRQFVEEGKMPVKQSNMLCPAHDLRTISRHEAGKNSFLTEGEDEAVGNVVNVRYPYDWEQVSEVLCGGTPDFFQLPTF